MAVAVEAVMLKTSSDFLFVFKFSAAEVKLFLSVWAFQMSTVVI